MIKAYATSKENSIPHLAWCYLDFPHLGVISLFLTLVLFHRKAPFLFFRLARRLQRSRRTPLSFSFFLTGRYPKFSGAFSLIGQSSWHQDKDFSIRRTHRRSCPFLVKLNEPSTSYPHWIKLCSSFEKIRQDRVTIVQLYSGSGRGASSIDSIPS